MEAINEILQWVGIIVALYQTANLSSESSWTIRELADHLQQPPPDEWGTK